MSIKLLAIDTTESACSAALLMGDEVRYRFELADRRHSERILPMMDSLLADAGLSLNNLDALAFGRGPGSFTGLRIAAGVIQGAAFGAGLPVVPVSTLRALAQGAFREQGANRVMSALDARMAEVYWAAFVLDDEQLMEPVSDEMVCAPTEVPEVELGDWCGAGSGWQAYAQVLSEQSGVTPGLVLPELQVHAQDTARIAAADFVAGKAVDPEQAIPIYLRDNVAKKKAAR